MSPDEVRLVFQKKFGSKILNDYPFSEGERQQYQKRAAVRLPIEATAEGQESPFIDFSCEIQFRSDMPLDTCGTISSLCNLNYPFALCIDNKNVDWKVHPSDLSDEQKDLAKSLFITPLPPGPDYVMAGDVALRMAYSGERLELHLAVRPGFKAAEWIVVGRLTDEDEMELFKGMRKMWKMTDNDDDDSAGPFYVSVF